MLQQWVVLEKKWVFESSKHVASSNSAQNKHLKLKQSVVGDL